VLKYLIQSAIWMSYLDNLSSSTVMPCNDSPPLQSRQIMKPYVTVSSHYSDNLLLYGHLRKAEDAPASSLCLSFKFCSLRFEYLTLLLYFV